MTTTAGNRWDLLPEPMLDPPTIDVVIPYYNQPEILQLTLLGLARQSIAPERCTITVVDDGSDHPPVVPPELQHLDVEIMRQARYGPRRSHARNLGATRGAGEVLLFLDADMVPVPSVLARHANWHRRTERGVTVSLRRHLDDGLIDDPDLRTAIHKRLLPSYRGFQKARFPAFIEGHLIRTDQFRSGADDIFYAMSAGCIGINRELFDEVGGFDERFGGWGGEDLELGFRLFTQGADVIPLPDAQCLHLGLGTSATTGAAIDQRTQLAPFIAHYSLRGPDRPDLTSPVGPNPTAQVQLQVQTVDAAADYVDRAETMIADDPFTDVARVPDDTAASTGAAVDTATAAPMQIQLNAATTLPRHPISRLWSALHSNPNQAMAVLPNGAGFAVRTRAIHRCGFDLEHARQNAIIVDVETRPPGLPEINTDRSRRGAMKNLLGRIPAAATRPLSSVATRAYAEVSRRR